MANEYIELPLLSSLQEEQVGSTTDYANVVDLSGNVNIGSVIDDNITGDYQIIDGFYENTTPNEVPYYANTFNSTFKINLNPNSNPNPNPNTRPHSYSNPNPVFSHLLIVSLVSQVYC